MDTHSRCTKQKQSIYNFFPHSHVTLMDSFIRNKLTAWTLIMTHLTPSMRSLLYIAAEHLLSTWLWMEARGIIRLASSCKAGIIDSQKSRCIRFKQGFGQISSQAYRETTRDAGRWHNLDGEDGVNRSMWHTAHILHRYLCLRLAFNDTLCWKPIKVMVSN